MLLVLSNNGKGVQSSSEQPLVGEERYVTTLITAAYLLTKTRNESKIHHSHPYNNWPEAKHPIQNKTILSYCQ